VNSNKDQHLNDDQIVTAVVEVSDLPESAQKHLASCHQCRLAVEKFGTELSNIGELARHFSPMSKQRIKLPVEKSTKPILGSWKWQMSFGAAFSAILVVAMLWWSGMTPSLINGGPKSLSGELWEDEALMTEISSLTENALPQLYLDITGETDPEDEDDFMNFIDPLNEDISLSENKWRKGVNQC
jgi:hypothetical protein